MKHRAERARRPWRRPAFASVVVLTALSGTLTSTESSLVGSGNRAQATGTAPLVEVGLATAASTSPQQYVISGMAPGSITDQLVNLQNDGTATVPALEVAVTSSSSTSLDTDATNGLSVRIDRCQGPWQQAIAGDAASCDGSTTTVLASTPLATLRAAANPTSLSSGISALSTAGIDHLRVRFSLPGSASPAYASLTSTPTMTLWGAAPPSAPTAVTAKAGDGKVTVGWTAPPSSYGLPVTAYTATIAPGGATCSTAGATNCDITRLTDGTTYTATVTATTSAGTGPASTGSSAIPYPSSLLTSSDNVLWLDGADTSTEFTDTAGTTPVTAAGQNFSKWDDKSGKGHDVTTPGSAPSTDSTTFAGRLVPTFSNNEYLSRSDGFPTNSDYTEFAVYHSPSLCTGNILSGSGTRAFITANGGLAVWHNGSYLLAPTGGGASSYVGAGTFVDATETATVDVDGAPSTTGPLAYTNGDASIEVGAYQGGTGWCGQIAELAVFDRALSVQDRRTIAEYLGRKWNITLTPSAPIAVSATPTSSAADVAWTTPSWDGGAGITGYTATATPGGASCTTSGSSCRITGLTNGTAYTVSVTAANSVGSGVPASTGAFTVGGAPAAPTGLSLSPGSATLTAGWSAPDDGGSPITSYTATATPGGASCTTSTNSCTIGGLTNGTTYAVTVAATNSHGTGPSSSSVTGVPGSGPTTPGVPQSVTAGSGDGSSVVSWSAPPVDGGAAITSYTATATPGAETCSTAGTTCTITGLTDGVTYSVSVAATNSVGTGTPSTGVSASPVPALLTSSSSFLWLDGADESTEFQDAGETTTVNGGGEPIAVWKDKSGQHHDVTAASTDPTTDGTTFAGHAVPSFSSGAYLSRADGFPANSDYSVWAVFQATGSCTDNILSGSATRAFFAPVGYGLSIFHNGSVVTSPLNTSQSTSYLGTGTYVDSTKSASVDTDGVAPATGTLAYGNTDTAIQIGAGGNANGFCGPIAEVGAFNRVLTTAERRTLSEYLSHKWNIAITPGAPAAPTATVASTTSITARWTAPSYDGGSSVTRYTATASPGGGTCTGTVVAGCTIGGLTDGTSYTVTVAATNAVGGGPASGASTPVTP